MAKVKKPKARKATAAVTVQPAVTEAARQATQAERVFEHYYRGREIKFDLLATAAQAKRLARALLEGCKVVGVSRPSRYHDDQTAKLEIQGGRGELHACLDYSKSMPAKFPLQINAIHQWDHEQRWARGALRELWDALHYGVIPQLAQPAPQIDPETINDLWLGANKLDGKNEPIPAPVAMLTPTITTPPADRADSRADTSYTKRLEFPRDVDARDLANELTRELPKGKKSQSQIAREYTRGDEKRAQTLLKSIRRCDRLYDAVKAAAARGREQCPRGRSRK